MIFYPTLKSLKQKLKISPINTGRQFTHNGHPNGVVFDDIEGLNAMIGVNGCLHLKSGTESSMFQYRGQNQDYDVCKVSLERPPNISKEKQLLSICRTIAFEELLEVHPFVKFTSTRFVNGNPLCLNLTGMAQHYGLDTDCLDMTNNFDVASFFATCRHENGKYYPIGNISKPGVMYQIYDFLLPPFIENKNNQGIEVEFLGWQPLPRPEQQRASVLKVVKDTNLDTVSGVQKYYFKHSSKQSRKIWKQFNEGKALFPHDSAADLANECQKLNSFTKEQIKKAFERLEFWSGEKINNQEQILDSLKIEIIDNNGLSWDNLVETKQEYWQNKFYETIGRVRYRMAAYV